MISELLRNAHIDPIKVLHDNLELINNMYVKILADNLDNKDFGKNSNDIICVLISTALLSDNYEALAPISYEDEDIDLITILAEKVIYLLNLEKMTAFGSVTKTVVDGVPFYSSNDKKKKSKFHTKRK